jgi:RNA polymerase sigma-70 factor (ECF subfamily)
MALRGAERPLRLVPPPGDAAPASARAHDELAEVAGRAGKGEPKAIQTLLSAVLPHMLRVVRRVLGAQHAEVEDVVQDAASNLLDALPRFKGEAGVLHFACRVAVLSAMSARRKRSTLKRALLTEADIPLEQLSDGGARPDREVEQKRSAEAVRELLDSLPLAQAEVLALHCVLGYTVAEIAAAASISPETVRSRLRLAKQRSRERADTDARLYVLAEEP